MNNYIGEFLGTLFLIAFGTGFLASISLNKSFAKGMLPSWLQLTIAWGFALMLGVFVADYFGSGAHLNPALTIALAIAGLFEWALVPGYILAQVAGAFVGAGLVILLYYTHFQETPTEEGNSVGIFATGPAIPNTTFNLISEILVTFILIFVLLLMNTGEHVVGVRPVTVGFLLMGIGLSFGSTTGYCLNPARDFGPRLAYSFLPVPNKGDSNWGYAWIPIVGPIIGATLAVLLFQALSAGM